MKICIWYFSKTLERSGSFTPELYSAYCNPSFKGKYINKRKIFARRSIGSRPARSDDADSIILGHRKLVEIQSKHYFPTCLHLDRKTNLIPFLQMNGKWLLWQQRLDGLGKHYVGQPHKSWCVWQKVLCMLRGIDMRPCRFMYDFSGANPAIGLYFWMTTLHKCRPGEPLT